MFKIAAMLVLVGSGLGLLSFGFSANAQGTVKTVCDAAFNTARVNPENIKIPSQLTGKLYFSNTILSPSAVTQITQGRQTTFATPFASDSVKTANLLNPLVSPTSQFVVFSPGDPQTPLTLWKLETGEVITLALTTEEARELTRGYLPLRRAQHKLIWKDANTLVLNYFDYELVDTSIPRILASQEFIIQDNPFRIRRGNYTAKNYPSLTFLDLDLSPRIFLSPQSTYTVVTTTRLIPNVGGRFRTQIFQTISQELLLDLFPDKSNYYYYAPLWTQDERRYFVQHTILSDTDVPHQQRLVEINVTQGVTQNNSLWEKLEQHFGNGVSLVSSRFEPILSPDDSKLAFRVYVPNQRMDYLVSYSLITGEIIAACDNTAITNTDTIISFWSPDSRFVGHWDQVYLQTIVMDTKTGQMYAVPTGSGTFAGWVSE